MKTSLGGCYLLSLLLLVVFGSCNAILPTAELDVLFVSEGGDSTVLSQYNLLASQASFGSSPPMRGTKERAQPLQFEIPPQDNPELCYPLSTQATTSVGPNAVLLVPRGTCTFQTKAYHAQQLGAKAIIIYGSLNSRYALNTTNNNNSNNRYTIEDIIWPVSLNDYDCNKGRALIPNQALSFQTLPYDASYNDPILSQESKQNLCLKNSPDSLDNCPSKACFLTGKQVDDDDNQQQEKIWEACCAWDLHVWMYFDPSFYGSNHTTTDAVVNIPAVYITLQQGQLLLKEWNNHNNIQILIYERWRPKYNPSSAILWIWGVFVAALAAHWSASDYHQRIQQIMQRSRNPRTGSTPRTTTPPPSQPPQIVEETLELNAFHAVVFLVMASSSLLVLFYFKIYGVVKVLYALGCSKALATVLMSPFIQRLLARLHMANRTICHVQWEDLGDITLADVLAHGISYSLGLAWLIVAFSFYHPETINFFWIMQDIFGACMCISFLQVIKLNSIRVASILLVIAFFYDIFFVFVSPLIFKKSVMMDVATSGGPPPNPEWCEKYPDDPVDCRQRGNPLPMLFAIPRIADYQGGANLLGLGDIVVPGLLISFAARFDAAKSLLGVMGGGNGSLGSYACPERRYCGSTCWNGGYFVPVVIAYGVGLLMANTAVYLMDMGQPALLYLVPCCLGMVLLIGWRRKELPDLWDGPKAIRAADAILYGEPTNQDGATTTTTATSSQESLIPQRDEYDNENSNALMQALTLPSDADYEGEMVKNTII